MTTALVTGATAGIGKTFSEQLAQRGDDLILVARDEARLGALKTTLEDSYGISVEVIPADLADRAQVQRVADRLAEASRPVDLLVNNAGFGLRKAFLRNPVEDEERMLAVLVQAPVVLSHAAAGAMRERGHGTIINVASVAGHLTSGTYAAAKSYLIAFSQGLASEVESSGVLVTVLCPGFTRTEFHERAEIKGEAIPKFMWLQADALVRDCLRDVARRKTISVPGAQYKAIVPLLRIAPRRLLRNGKIVAKHRPNK
ncbi:SDR family NAD(P)-dependent oxidoreductase [Demetria terragena]|uniref:SDR family NAD(P)-dependent oxidoreductase n=1 Tax=Demetria terragena TaxID=63959 RepID=UPI0003785677|nr:SDR family oxidoreductase [Demetria terragena]